MADYDLDQYLPSNTLHLYGDFLHEAGYPKEFTYDDLRHKEAYVFLRERVWQFVQDGGEVELFRALWRVAEWIDAHRDHEIEQHRSHVNGDLQLELSNSDIEDNNIDDNNIEENNPDKNNLNNTGTTDCSLIEPQISLDHQEAIGADGFFLNI